MYFNNVLFKQISGTMAKFEDLFEDLDTHTQVMDSAMSTATTLNTPQNQVDSLMTQVGLQSFVPFLTVRC